MFLGRTFAVIAASLTIFCSTSYAEVLCQRKNSTPPKNKTRVQAIKSVQDGQRCPSGFVRVIDIPNTSTIRAVATDVIKTTQIKTDPVTRPGDAPISITLNASTTNHDYACQTVDLEKYCADSDGCVVRMAAQDLIGETVFVVDTVALFKANPSSPGIASMFNQPGSNLSGHPQYSHTIIGTNNRTAVWSPFDGVSVLNHLWRTCPGQNGVDGPAFTGANQYKLVFLVRNDFNVTFTIFDS
jgi:hypothetical protein